MDRFPASDSESFRFSRAHLDILCLSHLRWNFVYQRPQHLLARASKTRRVFYYEEPVFDETSYLEMRPEQANLVIAVPHIAHGTESSEVIRLQKDFLDELMSTYGLKEYCAWYYTPMALKFTKHLDPDLTVYDCMDQLSQFKGAPPELPQLENHLFQLADLVFTGGYRLYEAKRSRHPSVYPFPSSVDVDHFAETRALTKKRRFEGLTIGYMGVIDERIDISLIEDVARQRPDWNIVMLGPVVKIDPDTLPRRPNIHYLGGKTYAELPAHLANWDIGMLPFAMNEATEFISPTKTPEYLAAGLQVISTPIRDVIKPYGERNLVAIVNDADSFIREATRLYEDGKTEEWCANVETFLKDISWEKTFQEMDALMRSELQINASLAKATSELSRAARRIGNNLPASEAYTG